MKNINTRGKADNKKILLAKKNHNSMMWHLSNVMIGCSN